MTNEEIEKLKAELNLLKSDISVHRKKGKDMFIAELKVMNLPSKIKMAEATLAQKDFQLVRTLLADAGNEVPQISKENFNKPTNDLMTQLKANIAQAKKDIATGNKKEAVEIYNKIIASYPSLDAEQKRELLPECKAILTALR